MRFLILNAHYNEFLRWFYGEYPNLEQQPYVEQLRALDNSLSGLADFYPVNLRRLGHEAWNVWVNNEFAQKAWGKEHGVRTGRSREWRFRLRRGLVPWVSRIQVSAWFYNVLAAQIDYHKPDVLLNMETGLISTAFLRGVKGRSLLIGWANPGILTYQYYLIPYRQQLRQDWSIYDFLLAPQEGMVDHFNGLGIRTELLRHAFEPRILSTMRRCPEKTTSVSFVGLLNGGGYKKRRELLEILCARMTDDISVWASSCDGIPPESAIRRRHRGHAWGQDLYQITANSKIALNCHSELEEQFAGNKRLFDATGLGTLLITDRSKNLHKIFEPGKEVATYGDVSECLELVRYYLDHDEEREAVARAGQRRTLEQHTYYQRMQELVDITQKYL